MENSSVVELTVTKSPSDELSLTNCLAINPRVFKIHDQEKFYVVISCNNGSKFAYGILFTEKVDAGCIGLSYIQRDWTEITLQSKVKVEFKPVSENYIQLLILTVDFMYKKSKISESFNTDDMLKVFIDNFNLLPFTKNQKVIFKLNDKAPLLVLTVETIKIMEHKDSSFGFLIRKSQVLFDKNEGSEVNLSGIHRGANTLTTTSILNPDWDFSKMGVGGLDKEFSDIFRRAFASRVYPPELIEKLGLQHVKGILLYGPPGTGKTLMARKIGKMLNATEPKIVNGPEILNKFVGESEKNIRLLFEDAETDQKKFGLNSPLHMIIFDEIDAICKQRGTVTGSTGVADTVVNQLLSKIDGVEQLNNILIIGMTNRKDLIDEALLRPGRLEVQMEINLPNEEGRLQILVIHTSKLKEHNKLDKNVNLKDISKQIKNYSGAEIEGLVRAATTSAMNKLVSQGQGKVEVDPKACEKLVVTKDDFDLAAHDIKPAFGTGNDDGAHYLDNGLVKYGKPVSNIIEDGELLIKQAQSGGLVSPVSVLLFGPAGSGKTTLAAHLAYELAKFPFIKVVSPENMIGYSESSKCQAIKKIFDDAYKSELSCIIVDDIERLLEYVPIGPRFSNTILQTLIVLLKKKAPKGHKLLIIGTSNNSEVLRDLQVLECFNTSIHVPAIKNIVYMVNVLSELNLFTESQLKEIDREMEKKNISVCVKKLISLAEMVKQLDEKVKVVKFICLLEQQCGIIY